MTDAIPSPRPFRLWTAISIVAGALQRRVWTHSLHSYIYPNLYVLLVAPPGIGKTQIINRAAELWRATENLHVAPNSITRAALVDVLARSVVKNVHPGGDFQLFHGLNIAASEFGVLVPAYESEYLSVLNDIFDCPEMFQEERRGRKEQHDIKYPILNILAGAQPGFLSELLPEHAWSMGFTSRLLMVYSGAQVKIELFKAQEPGEAQRYERGFAALKSDLLSITSLYGAVSWSPEAEAPFKAWYAEGLPPIPTHSRMQHYNQRRLLYIFKLAMISSASRGADLTIRLEDFQRAQEWLITLEERIPDIFREMSGKSDKVVLDDLHDFIWRMFARTKQSVHEAHLHRFLSQRVPSEKIITIMKLADSTGLILRDREKPTGFWKPGAKDNIPGVE